MTEFIEIFEKYLNMQNDISQTIDKYNKESFSTRSQIGQNAIFRSKLFKHAIRFMGKTI